MYERNRLYFERFKLIPTLVPPLAEQREIVEFVREETATLITAITRYEREISLLREYRTRLTADVVTGKLDVRAAASQLPEPVQDHAPAEAEALEEDSELEEVEA